eukprot:m51a1_g6336 putative multidrug resistance protein 1-like (1332) ;mRNA; f:21432-26198
MSHQAERKPGMQDDAASAVLSSRQQSPASCVDDGIDGIDLNVVEVLPPPVNPYATADLPFVGKGRKPPPKTVGMIQMFRFATKFDVCLILFGIVCATANGVLNPLYTILLGNMIDSFAPEMIAILSGSSSSHVTQDTGDVSQDTIRRNAFVLLFLGIASLVLHFLYVVSMSISAQRQSVEIRRVYVESVLCQEMGWFDSRAVGELTTRLSDVAKIQEGISERVGTVFQLVAMAIGGWIVAFVTGWKLSLILLSTMPLSVLSMGIFSTVFGKMVVKAQDHYAHAGKIAEEFISCIRTVTAFGIQRDAVDRYDAQLIKTRRTGYMKGLAMGSSLGFIWLIMFGTYGLAFWYGSKLSGDVKFSTVGNFLKITRKMEPGKIVTVFFGIMMGVQNIGQLGPLVNTIVEARGCAFEVFATIDRKSLIDKRKKEGQLISIKGDIEFRNVYFRYPTRPDVEILKDFSLKIKSGQTVAFVGASGCGKSTAVSLLERMYDVASAYGAVLIDGVPIQDINIECLRSQIGVVAQEPVLFAKTIGENIALGAVEPVTDEEIETAAKRANAHSFISQLPAGYNTLVGERGTQLSGGQKQRIAIARALIRKPKLLMFDEATSALDAESERIVQDAIDEICHGVTCIIIAHRLSTVRNADMIVAFQSGRVIETGTHEQLMEKKGLYHKLLIKQQLKGDSKKQAHKNVKAKAAEKKASDAEDVQKAEKAPSSVKILTLMRAFSLLQPDWLIVLIASISAFVNGAVFPVFALIFSEVIAELFYVPHLPGGDDHAHDNKVSLWSIGFLILGVVACVSQFLTLGLIEVSGERLTKYLRFESFKAMLRQEIGWFDYKQNMTGVLATRLATEATMVHGITGNQLTLILSMAASLISGIVIAFTGSWKVALVVLAVVPLMAGAAATDMRFMTVHQLEQKTAYESAGQVAAEAFENPRTVLIMGREGYFTNEYLKAVKRPMKKGFRATFLHAISGGLMDACSMWIAALALWYGGKLVANPHEHVKFNDVMKAQTGVMFGAISIGQLTAFLPDYGKAMAAAQHIFELLDRKPLVPPPLGLAPAGPCQNERLVQKLDAQRRSETRSMGDIVEDLKGDIEFRNVEFEYPTRPGLPILRGINLHARPNQTLALVGSSGCGKSTVISLLERMYNPLAGEVLLDGKPLDTLDVSWLRSQMGLVGQEPVLFGGTIRDNIAHGKPGASMDEIIAAAKLSNAHGFISCFPQGYETVVAEKGVTLSGGQKQRIAIARALIRNPRILLLDEATSALDSNSEAVVQEALDRAREGRTTIVIAHRLSTIVAADQIAVFDSGVVVECGTHEQLMAMQGHYYNLASHQLK